MGDLKQFLRPEVNDLMDVRFAWLKFNKFKSSRQRFDVRLIRGRTFDALYTPLTANGR